MNNDDKILKALDNLQAGQDRSEKTVDQHGKILNQHGQVLTSLVQNVATVLQKQQEQGKDIKAIKEVVKFVDMKVEAGNNKQDRNVAELKEELAKKADKADVINLGAKIDKVTKDQETRIKELEEDQGIHHRDKN